MVRIEDDCVGCPPEMGCLGSSCPYVDVPHYYCDKCGDEVDILYDYDGMQLCESCLLEEIPKVDGTTN